MLSNRPELPFVSDLCNIQVQFDWLQMDKPGSPWTQASILERHNTDMDALLERDIHNDSRFRDLVHSTFEGLAYIHSLEPINNMQTMLVILIANYNVVCLKTLT